MLKKACCQTVLMWGCLGPSGNFLGFPGALAHLRYDCSCCLYVHAVPLSISSIFWGFCLPLFRTLLFPLPFVAHTWLLSRAFSDPVCAPNRLLKLTIQASQQEVASKGRVFLCKAVVPGVVSC